MCFIPQFTGSNTDEDADTYIELGNVSSVDLISFAYQIASGMVCCHVVVCAFCN